MSVPDRSVVPLERIVTLTRRRLCQITGLALLSACTGKDKAGPADMGAEGEDLTQGEEDMSLGEEDMEVEEEGEDMEPGSDDMDPESGDMAASCAGIDTGRTPASIVLNTAVPFLSIRAYLVRDRNGLFALSSACTHNDCDINFTTSLFTCPCHGSQFSLTGSVRRGPAMIALPHFALCRTDGGTVAIDRGHTVSSGTRYNF